MRTPPNPAFPNFWQALGLALAIMVILNFVGGVLYHDLRRALGLEIAECSILTGVLAYILLLALIKHYQSLNYRQMIHPSTSSIPATLLFLWPPVLLLLPGMLLLDAPMSAVRDNLYSQSLLHQEFYEQLRSLNPVMFLMMHALLPLLSAMLFQGVILRGFLRLYPEHLAIPCMALLSGLLYMDLTHLVLYFPLHCVLGWLYSRSKSVLPGLILMIGVTLHANLVPVESSPFAAPLSSPALLIFALLCAGLGVYCLRRLLPARRD